MHKPVVGIALRPGPGKPSDIPKSARRWHDGRPAESPSRLRGPLYSVHNAGMHAAAPVSLNSRAPAYAVTVSEVLRLALPPGSEVVAGHAGMGRGIFWARLLGARQGLL